MVRSNHSIADSELNLKMRNIFRYTQGGSYTQAFPVIPGLVLARSRLLYMNQVFLPLQ